MCEHEGSGESARMHRLAGAFAGRLCDKYHNLMSWQNFDLLRDKIWTKSILGFPMHSLGTNFGCYPESFLKNWLS